jgi:hypothetical protein
VTYYNFPFTLSALDSTVTIALGGYTYGSASAQTSVTLYVTDFFITYGTVSDRLVGNLELVNGTFTAPTVAGTTISATSLDVTSSLVTHSTTTTSFQGPVNATNTVTCTGDITTSTLHAAGIFADNQMTCRNGANFQVNCEAGIPLVGAYLVVNGATTPFVVDGYGNIQSQQITSNSGGIISRAGFRAYNGVTYPFQVDSTTGNITTIGDLTYGSLPVSLTTTMNSKAPIASPTFTGTVTIPTLVLTSGETDNGNLSVAGTTTLTGLLTTNGGISNTGSLTTNGDITFNGNRSLNSIYNLRTSGTFASTTTFQTIYNITSPQCGFIRVATANTSYPCMVVAMFEWTNLYTYASLTQIASSGNAVQAAINTTNTGTGTQYISLQLVSGGTAIQVKTTANQNVTWYVTIL